MDTLTSEFGSAYGDACFNYSTCVLEFVSISCYLRGIFTLQAVHSKGVCNTSTWPGTTPQASNGVHTTFRYNDASAAWVLICAIIVFFMVRQCVCRWIPPTILVYRTELVCEHRKLGSCW